MGAAPMSDRKSTPISDGIRAAIRASGRSVYSIAKQVECSPQQLYNFLGGKRGLSQEILDRLAVALGLEIMMRSAVPAEVTTTVTQADVGLTLSQSPPVGSSPAGDPDGTPCGEGEATVVEEPVKDHKVVPSQATARPEILSRLSLDKLRSEYGVPGGLFRSKGRPPRVTPPGSDGEGGGLRPTHSNGGPATPFRGRPGVIPRSAVAAPGTKPPGEYDPEKEATKVKTPHTNAAQKDKALMMDLWGPSVKKSYDSLGRDTPAKENIYNFLAALGVGPATRKHVDTMKKFPMGKVVKWVLAYTPEQQMQIAERLPFLGDILSDDDLSVIRPFWDRVDQGSFFNAVGRLGFEPDPGLRTKYIDRKVQSATSGSQVRSEARRDDEGTDDPGSD